MNFERGRAKPFTAVELEQLLDEAARENLPLVEQMAGALADAQKYFDKQRVVMDTLLDRVSGFLALAAPFMSGGIIEKAHSSLQEMVKGLREGAAADPQMLKMTWEHGTGFEVRFRQTWVVEILAAALADLMRKPDGSYWNNVTSSQMSYRGEVFSVEVQRKSGKTCKEQRDEAEERVKELTTERDTLRDRVDELCDQCGDIAAVMRGVVADRDASTAAERDELRALAVQLADVLSTSECYGTEKWEWQKRRRTTLRSARKAGLTP